MTGTGLVEGELREYTAPGQFQVFLNGTLHSPVDFDS
jgi:hypothetical protein